MRRWKLFYIAAVFMVGFGSAPAVFLVGDEVLTVAFGQLALAVLSYPLGVASTALCFGLIYSGLVTPTEALAIATPVYAVLGYLQWYRIIPGFFRRATV